MPRVATRSLEQVLVTTRNQLLRDPTIRRETDHGLGDRADYTDSLRVQTAVCIEAFPLKPCQSEPVAFRRTSRTLNCSNW